MIQSVTVINSHNEALTMELKRPAQSGLNIFNIEGIGPETANINVLDNVILDGGSFISARMQARNIVFTIRMMFSPDIETSRHLTYKYFPIKGKVWLMFKTDHREIEISGYVESNTPNIFTKEEETQISIICPDPRFYSHEVFNELISELGTNINYRGELETGFEIDVNVLDLEHIEPDDVYNDIMYKQGTVFSDVNDKSIVFSKAIEVSDEKVIMVPYGRNPYIYIYNPITNQLLKGPAHGKQISGLQNPQPFKDGLLLPNGKIILVPYDSSTIGIYDSDTNTYTEGPIVFAFSSAVLMSDGKVLMIPFTSFVSSGVAFGNEVGIYDPITNVYIEGPRVSEGLLSGAFSNGVLLPDGKVLLIPYSFLNMLLYDRITNRIIEGPVHNEGVQAFSAGILTPNGKVILVPDNSNYIGIYDIATNTYSRGPEVGPTRRYADGVYNSRRNLIYMIPAVNSEDRNINYYNPSTNILQISSAITHVGGFNSMTVLNSGQIITVAADNFKIGIITIVEGGAPSYETVLPFSYNSTSVTVRNAPFHGGILMSNSKVLMIPWWSNNSSLGNPPVPIGIYDPENNILSKGPVNGWVEQFGTGGAFFEAVIILDGNVLLIPWYASWFFIYNPNDNTITRTQYVGTTRFRSGVLLPNGKVLLIPNMGDSSDGTLTLSFYNPTSNELEEGPRITQTNVWFSKGVLMSNGKVLLIPGGGNGGISDTTSSIYLNIYDPDTNTIGSGPAINRSGLPNSYLSTAGFSSGVNLSDGKVLLVPVSYRNIGLYNPLDNTYSTLVHFQDNWPDNTGFSDGILMNNNMITLVPTASNPRIGIYDYNNNVYIQGPLHRQGAAPFINGIFLPRVGGSNRVLMLPGNGSNAAYIANIAHQDYSIVIRNTRTGEFFGFKQSLTLGDRIVINTKRGQKSITLYDMEGNSKNLISFITNESTWLQLYPGVNPIEYTVETGEADDIEIVFNYQEVYQGV